MGFFDRFKIPTNVGKHNPNDSETTKLLPNDKIYKKPTNVGQHDPINSEITKLIPNDKIKISKTRSSTNKLQLHSLMEVEGSGYIKIGDRYFEFEYNDDVPFGEIRLPVDISNLEITNLIAKTVIGADTVLIFVEYKDGENWEKIKETVKECLIGVSTAYDKVVLCNGIPAKISSCLGKYTEGVPYVVGVNTEIMFLNDNISIDVSGWRIKKQRCPNYVYISGPYKTRIYRKSERNNYIDLLHYFRNKIIYVNPKKFMGMTEDEKIEALTKIYENNTENKMIGIDDAHHIVEYFSENCCNVRLLNHLRVLVNYYMLKEVVTFIYAPVVLPLFT